MSKYEIRKFIKHWKRQFWLDRACLIADSEQDPESKGIPQYQSEEIEEIMLDRLRGFMIEEIKKSVNNNDFREIDNTKLCEIWKLTR